MPIGPATSLHTETTEGNLNEGKPSIQHADDALAFVTDHENVAWTREEEAKVLRKIDLVILPLVCSLDLASCKRSNSDSTDTPRSCSLEPSLDTRTVKSMDSQPSLGSFKT